MGQSSQLTDFIELFRKDLKIGLRPVFILSPENNEGEDPVRLPVYPIDRLKVLSQQHHVRVAAVIYEDLNEVEAICTRYRDTFERIALFDAKGNHFFLNKMKVQQYGGLISLEVRHSLLDPWAQALKRVLDTVISGILLILLLPFFLLVAGCIYIDSPGPIFYRQTRLGKKGKPFTMLKFRTMHTHADEMLTHT